MSPLGDVAGRPAIYRLKYEVRQPLDLMEGSFCDAFDQFK